MTVDDYYAAVRRLRLRATSCPTVFMGPDEMTYNVPDPTDLPEAVRRAIIENLKQMVA